MRPLILAVFAVLVLLPGAAAAQYDNPDPGGGGGGSCEGENIVRVRDNFFEPETITVKAGETVTWCYEGPSMAHNVVENGGAFRCANGCDPPFGSGNGNPSTNWVVSVKFNRAGTVGYFCEVHEALGMRGTVIVEGGGGGGGGDQAGNLRLAQSSYTVGEAAGQVTVGVVRAGGDDGAVGVLLSTSNGSATAGQDYTSTTTTVSFGDGEDGTKTVAVPILNDGADEGDETFTVRLTDPTGGASTGSPSQATVTITDDDAAPQGPGSLSFGSFAFAGVEGGDAVLEVVRRGGAAGGVSVEFQTAAGSATPGGDYQPKNGMLQIPAGETRGTISVPLPDDGDLEGVKSFRVNLASPGGGASLGAIRTATVLVFDDDEVPVALTADEVLCDGFRLATLLDRLEVVAPNTSKALGINVTFTELGDFAGIAYTGNGPGTAEHQLAFSTNPEETTFLRNPGRAQLFAISLTRNQTNSDLVPRGAADEIRLFLNPTQAADPDPLSLLEINAVGDPVTRQGGTPAESKPGRGLADAVRLCHGPLNTRDQHVFQVLAKIARVSADGAAAVGIAVFRGEAPDAFQIDAYPLDGSGASMGRLAAELEIDFGPGDRLDAGTLRVLGRCGPGQSANCTSVTGFTELQLVEPTLPGEFWNDSPFAVSTSGVEGDGQPTSNVDFAALLEGTSWRRPL